MFGPISEIHCRSSSLANCADTFQHQSGLVLLDDFLTYSAADFLVQQCKDASSWDRHTAVYAHRNSEMVATRGRQISEKDWISALEQDRFFCFSTLSPTSENFQLIEGALQKDRFHQYVSSVVDKSLGQALVEVHRFKEGDFLGYHSDARAGRMIGVVLYVGEWEKEYGGIFELTYHDGKTERVVPKHNRLVLFDVEGHREHCVSRIISDRYRYSINLWFHGRMFE